MHDQFTYFHFMLLHIFGIVSSDAVFVRFFVNGLQQLETYLWTLGDFVLMTLANDNENANHINILGY